MSKEDCPNPQPDCKYYPDCFADRHHLYPQRLGKTALALAFLNLPENIVQPCRRLHEESAPEYYLPAKSVMREAVRAAALRGDIHLSVTKLKKIFNVNSIEELRGGNQ